MQLIQRAGSVDLIGEKANEKCATHYVVAEGVERITWLHQRVRRRLKEIDVVIGADELFSLRMSSADRRCSRSSTMRSWNPRR
jgi:hypothetical protein